VPTQAPTPERFAPPAYIPPPPSARVPHGFPKPKLGRGRVALRVALAAIVFSALTAVGVAFRGDRLPFTLAKGSYPDPHAGSLRG
jgi:hypothetical protein